MSLFVSSRVCAYILVCIEAAHVESKSRVALACSRMDVLRIKDKPLSITHTHTFTKSKRAGWQSTGKQVPEHQSIKATQEPLSNNRQIARYLLSPPPNNTPTSQTNSQTTGRHTRARERERSSEKTDDAATRERVSDRSPARVYMRMKVVLFECLSSR